MNTETIQTLQAILVVALIPTVILVCTVGLDLCMHCPGH